MQCTTGTAVAEECQLQPKGSCQEVKGSSTALKGTWPSSTGQEWAIQGKSPDGEILVCSRRASLAAHACIHRGKTASCVRSLRPCLPKLLLRITCGLHRPILSLTLLLVSLNIAADVTQHCCWCHSTLLPMSLNIAADVTQHCCCCHRYHMKQTRQTTANQSVASLDFTAAPL